MNAGLVILIVLHAIFIAALVWVIACERRDARRFFALYNHPGREVFLRHVEAWQLIALGGELAKPTVDEMVTHYGVSTADAQAYVDEWDDAAEVEQHAERVQLADFASKLTAWVDPK